MAQTTFGISNKILFSVLALAALLWGLLGLKEITRVAYTGYLSTPDSIVTTVKPGSPAEAAGLQIGDEITKIDGLAVNSKALQERGRSEIGSEQKYTILRKGVEQSVSLRLTERPTSDILLYDGAGILVGLLSLILGLFLYLRNPTRLSSLLCVFLIGWGFLFMPQPYFSSPDTRGFVNVISNLIASLTLAALVMYCLRFPTTKRVLENRPWLSTLVYGAAIAVSIVIAYLLIARPELSGSARSMVSAVIGTVYGLLFLGALVAMLHTYFKSKADDRSRLGLNWMLAGVILGVAPIVITLFLNVVLPRIGETPLDRIITILFLALPVCFARALMIREPVTQGVAHPAAT